MKQLAAAILAVMDEVKGIEKNLTVGEGKNAYKGVSDKDVKNNIGAAMHKNGLCIIPTSVQAKTQIDRWEETTVWNGTPQTKAKQSVFVECETKYLLLHSSGESIEVAGYGHGVDSQDKASGKATTYGLKNALLYLFMVPTGTIDDADKTHSDEHPVAPAKTASRTPPPPVQYSPEIFKEIQACMTEEDQTKLWNKYPSLHNVAEFKAKMKERRIEINTTKA